MLTFLLALGAFVALFWAVYYAIGGISRIGYGIMWLFGKTEEQQHQRELAAHEREWLEDTKDMTPEAREKLRKEAESFFKS